MNKKSAIEIANVVVAFAIIAIFLLILAGFFDSQNFVPYDTSVYRQRINDNLFLVNLLRAEYNGRAIQDIVMESHYKNDFAYLKTAVGSVLEDAFGQRLCWGMVISDHKIEEQDNCKKMSELKIGESKAEIELPSYEGNIKVSFYNEFPSTLEQAGQALGRLT